MNETHTPKTEQPDIEQIAPTPWMRASDAEVLDANGGYVCTCRGCRDEAIRRRDHIIRCVNAHEKLLEACEAAMRKIEAYEDCPAAGIIAAEDMPEEWELCRAALAEAKPDA